MRVSGKCAASARQKKTDYCYCTKDILLRAKATVCSSLGPRPILAVHSAGERRISTSRTTRSPAGLKAPFCPDGRETDSRNTHTSMASGDARSREFDEPTLEWDSYGRRLTRPRESARLDFDLSDGLRSITKPHIYHDARTEMRHNDRERVKTRQFLFSSCGILKIENVIFFGSKKDQRPQSPFFTKRSTP